MELFKIMTDYFSLTAIGEVQTFPELLQALVNILCCMYLIVMIFRALFAAMWKIRQELTARR